MWFIIVVIIIIIGIILSEKSKKIIKSSIIIEYDEEQIQIGQVQEKMNVSQNRVLNYTLEICHKGLKEHKLISAPDINVLSNKTNLQVQEWTEKWQKIESKHIADAGKFESKRRNDAEKEAGFKEADLITEKANKLRSQIDNILIFTLSVDDKINWENLKKRDMFPEKSPAKPTQKDKKEYPPKPDRRSYEFTPVFTSLENLFKSKKEKKIQEFEIKYLAAVAEWEKQKSAIDKFNSQLDKDFEDAIRKWESDIVEWKKRKNNFLQTRDEFNAKIDRMKELYLSKNSDSIVKYCEVVLNNSEYPNFFQKNFELEYNANNNMLIVEYELPGIECFPKVKEVKYDTARKKLKESYILESQLNRMFDETIYRITLRTIHELFEADIADAIEVICFNGWVKAINRATGIKENNCILSIQAKKAEFLAIDLSNVDSKTCFKNLKGVAASTLSSLTPVQPILQISRVDRRFVEGYAVANQIDNTTNLAAMDWQDFEHLIRELFEKEFLISGGEVKVTQASRDGGVDAIAFDPDPIRGGKIVIQAKRYTNTVGVSAVRDLYGTVINEGATKGILVSTSDYGHDAYEFAKGKPLTLLNGSNLLHLLEKHGHHARIDLKEAKRILSEKDE
jgi:restriction system protein